ncbi:S8 family serine peptidase [Pseudokineococcus sp. 1T1Z-3]|uniref:S8 family serine peptidase n=1 Tax=Pseudokineococcus sp. 1T1Z-3 TaxID=3132745 RepID=UPI00309769AF
MTRRTTSPTLARRPSRGRSRALAVAAALAASTVLLVPGAGASEPTAAEEEAAGLGLSERIQPTDEPQAAFVRLRGPGALEVDAQAKSGDLTSADEASAPAQERVEEVEEEVEEVVSEATDLDEDTFVLYESSYTVPGVAVHATPEVLAALAERPEVLSVDPITIKTVGDPDVGTTEPANTGADLITQSLKAWTDAGRTGEGVNIAVIDTGIDYTHTDFGGPGGPFTYRTAAFSTEEPSPDWYDPEKYLGGWDFAGTRYTIGGPAGADIPVPDPNPIDGFGGGHGTHVAGTAAGYGTDAEGATFRGDHTSLTEDELATMRIGPGSAPKAGLYSLKVFGDQAASTALTGAALDWVGEALTRGEKIDVVNMSLGSSYSAPDDPDNAKVAALVEQGVLPVISAGNSGDVTSIAGSPGNAAAALTVSASASGRVAFDNVLVDGPEELAGSYRAQYSQNYALYLNVSGRVVTPGPGSDDSGCTAFPESERERLSGNLVLLEWDDDNIVCGSAQRFDNVEAIGGTGVLLTSTLDSFGAGIGGNLLLPGAQLTASASEALRPAAEAGTLEVTLREDLKTVEEVDDPEARDRIADFTSRGAHGSYEDLVKPDVAAPGVGILSAQFGSGNGRTAMSGTSMAAPHAAGVAALVVEAHPDWTARQVKANIMNTATHDTTTEAGDRTPLLRQGTGRVDALQAVSNQVLVRSQENGDLVTASFGHVEIARNLREQRTLELTNTGSTDVTYDVALEDWQPLPGVEYRVSPRRVTVPAGGSATATVTLRVVDATALRRVLDPTQERSLGSFGGQPLARDVVPVSASTVSFTPVLSDATPLRLAAFAAPEPVAAMSGRSPRFGRNGTEATLALRGRSLDQGEGDEAYASLVAPFVHGTYDAEEDFSATATPWTLRGLDIRRIGASSTAPLSEVPADGQLSFGVEHYGPTPLHGPTGYPEVRIDVDRDRQADFGIILSRPSSLDTVMSVTYDMVTGRTVAVTPVGGGYDGPGDLNVLDSSVAVLTTDLAALGYEEGSTSENTEPLRYQVVTSSLYAPGYSTAGDPTVDSTRWVDFDAFDPAYWFTQDGEGGQVFRDDSRGLQVHRDGATDERVLLLHLHNANGRQAEVLQVR